VPAKSGAVVIITGAAQGLGRAYALRFGAAGWRVVVADVNGEKAATVCAEIAAAGGDAVAVPADVSEERDCTAMVAAATERYGRVDALVNNAAVTTFERKFFLDLTVAEWDRMFAVNVRGAWLAMRAVVPVMEAQGGGSIVNIASNTYVSGRVSMTHYVSSKGAVIGLTRATARELGERKIRVNCVLPGATQTEVAHSVQPPERQRVLLESQSIKRMEEPDDLAGAVLFLASADAGFITGQSLVVDGGFVFL
jgi:3-oxoacyl-[acyl-carrier protein] reductase